MVQASGGGDYWGIYGKYLVASYIEYQKFPWRSRGKQQWHDLNKNRNNS